MQSTLLVYLPSVWDLRIIRSASPRLKLKRSIAAWLRFLDDEFVRPQFSGAALGDCARPVATRSTSGHVRTGPSRASALTSELPGTILAYSLDPANVTLEPEYYPETDRERFARRKPLLWFWKMFDRSPIRAQPLAGAALSLHAGAAHF